MYAKQKLKGKRRNEEKEKEEGQSEKEKRERFLQVYNADDRGKFNVESFGERNFLEISYSRVFDTG